MKSKPIDIEAILATIPDGRSPGTLDRWLAADQERSTRFYGLMTRGQAMGKSLDKLLGAWNAHHEGEDRCPVKQNQVRLALRAREAERAVKRG